jgi:hypothetical protein
MGDSVDARQGMILSAGGFITAPALAHHFAVARRKTVIQVHGEGPFAITYLRAVDDPRAATASRSRFARRQPFAPEERGGPVGPFRLLSFPCL